MEKAQPVRCLGEQRRDGVVGPLFHITENDDAIPIADMKGGSDALEEPGPRVDTLLLRRSDCNGEDVPVAVDCRSDEDDATVLLSVVASVDAKHLQRMAERRRAHSKHGNALLRGRRQGECP